jgi:hypothetical protein
MLQVDLTTPDSRVEQYIKQSCSKLGGVRLVRVHRSPTPFALIHMTTDQQNRELTSRFGGSVFGNCALVHLKQMPVCA